MMKTLKKLGAAAMLVLALTVVLSMGAAFADSRDTGHQPHDTGKDSSGTGGQ